MEKQHLFKKKYTVEKTENGYAIAVYGHVTGQVYDSEETALDAIKIITKSTKKKDNANND